MAENGAVVWQAQYAVLGKAEVEAGSTLTNNLRFPGQYYDAETGLHYNWNRHYDPEVGRYTQTDPIGFEGGDLNLYGYVRNDCVNSFDSEGLWVAPVIVGAYAVGAVIIFKDCMERCTGKEICDSNKVIDNHASAKCAKLCIQYAVLMGIGSDPIGSTASEIGAQIGTQIGEDN